MSTPKTPLPEKIDLTYQGNMDTLNAVQRINQIIDYLKDLEKLIEEVHATAKREAMREERERAVEIIKDELKTAPLEVQMSKGIIFASIVGRILSPNSGADKEAYERNHSHRHCPDTNSPCGFEGKHRCCLCGTESK